MKELTKTHDVTCIILKDGGDMWKACDQFKWDLTHLQLSKACRCHLLPSLLRLRRLLLLALLGFLTFLGIQPLLCPL